MTDSKELIRTEPTIRATFEEIDAEFAVAEQHYLALRERRNELADKLAEIAEARASLCLQACDDDTEVLIEEQGEPALPADKPIEEPSDD